MISVPQSRAVVAATTWIPAALAPPLGVGLLLVVAERGLPVAVVVAGALSAAGLGYAIEDSAAPTLDSSPTTLRARTGVRISLGAVAVIAGWLAQALVVGVRVPDHQFAFAGWWALSVACAAVTLATAAHVRRRYPGRVGATVAPTALGLLVLAALQWQVCSAFEVSPPLRLIIDDPAMARWWWVTAAAGVVLAYETRDHAARGCRSLLGGSR